MTSLSGDVVARRNTATPLISIVIPTLNEALNLQVVLPRLPKVHEVILVDGGSVDGTVETARRALPGIVVVAQTRRGRGNALATGFARVTGDVVITFDADGSADPGEIDRFVEALKGGADFAKGSRFTSGGSPTGVPLLRRLGNRLLSGAFSSAFRTPSSDLCYGYNAFWADLIPLLDLPDHTSPAPRSGDMLWGDGFEIETVISCRLASAGVVTVEVPSVVRTRLFGQPGIYAFSDGLRVLRTLRTERARARGVRRLERQLARDRG